MTAPPRPDRAEPDRAAAHRDGPDGAVQLPPRPAHRRHVHPASRGHRPGARLDRLREATSSMACIGSGSGGTKAPRSPARRRAVRSRRIARCSACRSTRRRPNACSPPTWPTRATARPRSSTPTARPRRRPSSRRATSAAAPTLTPEERAAREAEGRRGGAALPGRRRASSPSTTSSAATSRSMSRTSAAISSSSAATERRSTTSRWSSTTRRWRSRDVIRGEDHLSNTPKHILLFRALGYPEPRFAHLPLILNPDRTKMSKRKSQTAVDDYIDQGFIREALVNYLALLGWATGTEEEVLSIDEIVERFDLDAVHKGGAVFDRERLEWLNGQWIRRLEPDDLIDRLRPFVVARAGRWPDRLACRRTRSSAALLADDLGTPADAGRRRRPGRVPVGRDRPGRPGDARPEALGRRDDARGARRRPRGDRRDRAPSRSRPTSSSRRSGRSPRRVAGRPATCSWRSGSR